MRNHFELWTAVVLACGAWNVTAGSRVARACSGSVCSSPSAFPASGSVPAGWVKLTLLSGRDRDGRFVAPEPHLFALRDGARTELELTRTPLPRADGEGLVIAPADPPAVGTVLELEVAAPDCMGATDLHTQFTVTDAALAPTTLGDLRATIEREVLTVATVAGSCSIDIDAAYVDLELMLSDAARPFADVVAYQLLLDGEPQPPFTSSILGGAALPSGRERVYAPCEPDDRLVGAVAHGPHRARLRGELSDGTRLETPDVLFELSCTTLPDAATAAGGLAGRGAADPHASSDGGCSVTAVRTQGGGWSSTTFAACSVVLAWMFSRRRSTTAC